MLKRCLIIFTLLLNTISPVFAFEIPEGQALVSPIFTSSEMQNYSLSVGKKIIANFDLPNTDKHLSTVILFKVDKSGNLTEYKIIEPSGDSNYDARVISAIKKSSPYPVPNFEEAIDTGIILNMDLDILKLIKALSGLDENLDMEFNNHQENGKKFINPEDIEKSLY